MFLGEQRSVSLSVQRDNFHAPLTSFADWLEGGRVTLQIHKKTSQHFTSTICYKAEELHSSIFIRHPLEVAFNWLHISKGYQEKSFVRNSCKKSCGDSTGSSPLRLSYAVLRYKYHRLSIGACLLALGIQCYRKYFQWPCKVLCIVKLVH